MKGNCLTKGAFNLPSRFMRLRGSLKSIGNDQTLPFPFVVSLSNHERALPGRLGLSAQGRSLNHSKSSAKIRSGALPTK
jgi:hypothetical protein